MLESPEYALDALASQDSVDIPDTLPSIEAARVLLGSDDLYIEKIAPLTPMQRDLYLDHLVSEDDASFSIGTVVDLGLAIDTTLWRQAVLFLVDHEAILRTVFLTSQENIYQAVLSNAPGHFEYIDLLDGGIEPGVEFKPFILNNFIKVRYDLSETRPAIRNFLLKDSNGHYVAILACHHILCDGFAVKVFMERVGAIYAALAQRKAIDTSDWDSFYTSISDIRTQFDTPTVQEFWKQALQSVMPIQPYKAANTAKRLSQVEIVQGEELEALREFCQRQKYSLPAYFRSLFCILLNKYYDTQHDFAIYSLINGRPEAHKNALGCFIYALPIVVPHKLLEDASPFDELMNYMRKYRKANAAYQNISTFLQKQLLRKEPMRFYYNFLNFGSIQFLDRELELDLSVYDYYGFNEVHFVVDDKGDKIELWLYYDQGVFADVHFLDRIRALSQQVLGGTRLPGKMELLLEKEQKILLQHAGIAQHSEHKGVVYPELFTAQVMRTPDAIAASFDGEQISYAELDWQAEILARFLREKGVTTEVLVAIMAERQLNFLTSILSIFKAGAAYLPLNPYYPTKQLAEVLLQSRSPLVLVDRTFFPILLRALQDIPVAQQPAVHVLDDGSTQSPLPYYPLPYYKERNPLVTDLTAENLAYVIYTSGSTGAPKGVMIEQKSMLNHLLEKVRELQLSEKDVIAQNAAQSFDISVWQWLAALLVGGRVQIIADQYAHDPMLLIEQLHRYQVTVVEVVPSLIQGLFIQIETQHNVQLELPHVRWLLSTGEVLLPRLANSWLHVFPQTPIVNAYGPTECGDDVTHYFLDRPLPEEITHIPIGHVLSNLQLYVLDQHMRPVPLGLPGELYVGGLGIGRGYLYAALRTAAAFVPDPFHVLPGKRLYRTGDLVRFLSDGNLEYLSRTDYQVKVHGFRIELGEIEASLQQHADVHDAVVVVHEAPDGDKRLIAYVVARTGTSPTHSELRNWMRKCVAEYAIPAAFVTLEHLPLSTNGKVDRQALPQPDQTMVMQRDEEPLGVFRPTEALLAGIWSQVLGVGNIAVHDDFFTLGGNSLLAIRLVARIKEVLGVTISLRVLLSLPTIASLAIYIDEG